jgi:hypothetical protein
MYKIVFFVPQAYTEEVKLALFEAGAGGVSQLRFLFLANDRGPGSFAPSRRVIPLSASTARSNACRKIGLR